VERTVESEGLNPKVDSESPIPFFHILERLKTTPREGWRRFGIPSPESIADHMYRMSIITMFAPKPLSDKLNLLHCQKMALIHDMAEAIVGDITPVENVPKAEKSRRESTTMDYLKDTLLGKVNGGDTGKEMKKVWQEYEDGETLDSKFVHDVDKLELILQMFEYEKRAEGKCQLSEFAQVATKVVLPEVKQWVDEVLADRDVFWKQYPPIAAADEETQKQIDTAHDEYYGKLNSNK